MLAIGVVEARDVEPNFVGHIGVPAVRVRIAEDLSQWAAISAPAGGPGDRWWQPPAVGERVVVGYCQPNMQQPVVIGRLYTGHPPLEDSETEWQFNGGAARVHFDRDTATLTIEAGTRITLRAGGVTMRIPA